MLHLSLSLRMLYLFKIFQKQTLFFLKKYIMERKIACFFFLLKFHLALQTRILFFRMSIQYLRIMLRFEFKTGCDFVPDYTVLRNNISDGSHQAVSDSRETELQSCPYVLLLWKSLLFPFYLRKCLLIFPGPGNITFSVNSLRSFQVQFLGLTFVNISSSSVAVHYVW